VKQRAKSSNFCSSISRTNVQIVDRNRRASNALSQVFIHFVAPHGKLLQRLLALEQLLGSLPSLVTPQQHAGPREPHYGIPLEEWPNVVRRVVEHHEPLRQVAAGDACPTKPSDASFVLLATTEQDKPLSLHLPFFEDAHMRCDHSSLNAVHDLCLSRTCSKSPPSSSVKAIRSRLATDAPSLASSSRMV
jgi:hypothetical protein